MFPYPSGNLHMGHVRVYTISDAMARFFRMCGKNVLHPMGWDAFGLPAENAARERGIPADKWTESNIEKMKQQLEKLGCSFDWRRELATCSPEYYKWTQYLFLRLYREGLAYQREALVNWDPVDETVLADEQVDENGCSWRSGAKVEKRLLRQWFIRTTRFAKELLEGLDNPILEDWRDIVKLQKHWIGDCNGYSFDFAVVSHQADQQPPISTISVWTQKPELVKMSSFVAISKNHPLAQNCDGLAVQNPFTGQQIPFVIQEDEDFPPECNAFLGIPTLESLPEDLGAAEVLKKAQELRIGGFPVSSKLKDWLISRQRTWGTPIPIIHCPDCGPVPVPEESLPVTLENTQEDKVSCPKCKNPGAKREKDTMDTFVDSSWYFLRFLDSKNSQEIFRKDLVKSMPVDLYIGGKEHAVLHLYYARFMNHFLNSIGLVPEKEPFKRLLVQGMVMGRSFRVKGSGKYLPESEVEIIDEKRNKAMEKVSGKPVVVTWEKMSKSKLNGVDPEDVIEELGVDATRLVILGDVAPFSHRNWSRATFQGLINWQKRLWMTVHDFCLSRRADGKVEKSAQFAEEEAKLWDARNYYITGATFHFRHTHQLSVAISKMQGLTNSIRRAPPDVVQSGKEYQRALATQIIMLAPLAPHFASELWVRFASAVEKDDFLAWDEDVLHQRWPEVEAEYHLDLTAKVNGVELGVRKFPRRLLDAMTKEEATKTALTVPEVIKFIGEKKILDATVEFYPGLEIVVNVHAKFPPRQKEVEEKLQEMC
ncbi:leucine--tRNA ligase, mitochondrial [Phlebotomus argentipes]|uniref:leucine--tRNA ligase, mitochondrial n=1 Tax=Phlebotomus argentipes TaxID=94469 RepID=UPI002892BBDA|nr:leucine--tRNA ligase, mitochondrial [Phlebotomus argentipes]